MSRSNWQTTTESILPASRPSTSKSYANGPGAVFPARADETTQAEAAGTREDLGAVDTTSIDYLQQATVPLSSETHAGDDVVIYAWGPFAHLFSGTVEQNYIYHVLAHASKMEERTAASLEKVPGSDTASSN